MFDYYISIEDSKIEDYIVHHRAGFYIVPQKTALKDKLNFDIMETIEGTFFSSKIVEELKKANITGYRIKEGILNN